MKKQRPGLRCRACAYHARGSGMDPQHQNKYIKMNEGLKEQSGSVVYMPSYTKSCKMWKREMTRPRQSDRRARQTGVSASRFVCTESLQPPFPPLSSKRVASLVQGRQLSHGISSSLWRLKRPLCTCCLANPFNPINLPYRYDIIAHLMLPGSFCVSPCFGFLWVLTQMWHCRRLGKSI